MNERNKKKKTKINPIIEAAKTKAGGRIQKLVGYLGEGAGGKIELYLNLDMKTCLEFDEQDVIRTVESEKPTEPSLVFVRDQARIVVRHEMTGSSAAALSLRSCGCGGAGKPEAGFLAQQGPQGPTDPNPDQDCANRYMACRLRCFIKHGYLGSNDPLMEQACKDSCDAAYRLCRAVGGLGLII